MTASAMHPDVFQAVAEPVRRQLIGLLAGNRGRAVGDLVAATKRAQPAISKHLRILREAGVVRVRRHGRHRMYELNAEQLRPVHDWVSEFEQFWAGHLLRIKNRAESMAADTSQLPGAEHPPES